MKRTQKETQVTGKNTVIPDSKWTPIYTVYRYTMRPLATELISFYLGGHHTHRRTQMWVKLHIFFGLTWLGPRFFGLCVNKLINEF